MGPLSIRGGGGREGRGKERAERGGHERGKGPEARKTVGP